MSDRQIPTVGRIVHYYSHALPPSANNGMGAGPYAAVVVQTFPGSPYVNLKVLVPFGEDIDAGSVSEKPAEAGPSDDRYWMWPPRA